MKTLFLSICMVCALLAKAQYTTPTTCLAVVKKNGKQGILDCKGTLVAPMVYDTIVIQPNGYSIVDSAAKKGIINPSGNSILLAGIKKVAGLSNGVLHVVLANGRHAYYDTTGKKLFKQEYADGRDFHSGVALVYNAYDKAAKKYTGAEYINKKGEVVFDFKNPDYEYSFVIGDMHEGLARIDIHRTSNPDRNYSSSGPAGFIDTAGKIAIAPVFNIYPAPLSGISNADAYNFKGGYCIMPDCNDEYHCHRLGYIDRKGNWMKKGLYSAYPFDSNGLAFFSDSLGTGFFKNDFSLLYPQKQYFYGGANVSHHYTEGMLTVRNRTTWQCGYLTLDGKEAFFFGKDMTVSNYQNGVATVTKRNEKQEFVYALIDKKGNFITEFAKLPSLFIYSYRPVPATGIVVYQTDSSYQLRLGEAVVQEIKETKSFNIHATSCGLLALRKTLGSGSGRRFFDETTGQEIGTGYIFVTDFVEIHPETINKTDINKLDFNSAQLIKYIEKYSKD